MCTMAILYRVARGTPILIAANREERYDRPTQYPKIQSGTPRVVCGIDRRAGGTWLGVNQHGLFCAVANRRKTKPPAEPRSRGLLCRELLEHRTAKEAAHHAAKELAKGMYAGANYVCADGRYAAVVHGGDKVEIVELTPGLHVVSTRQRGRPEGPPARVRPPHVDLAHLGFGGDVSGGGQPGVFAEGGQRGPPRRDRFRRPSPARSPRRCSRCRGRSSTRSTSTPPARPATRPTTIFRRCCGRCFRPSGAARPARATASRTSTPRRRSRRSR